MKLAKYLSLALVTLASAALVGLASAEDAPIDPVPQEIVGFESLGVLDFADPNVKLDGWEARDKVTITRGEKSLVVDSTTSDPYISAPCSERSSRRTRVKRPRGRRS